MAGQPHRVWRILFLPFDFVAQILFLAVMAGQQLRTWKFLLLKLRVSSIDGRPTAENLIPIRIDVETDGQRYKDAFTWNASDPDSEIPLFAKRTVKDLNLPSTFVPLISQSIQTQVLEFRSYEGLEMNIGERVQCLKLDLRVNNTVIRDQFLWDVGNLESDPENFAKGLCRDLELEDPEVGPAIAVAIREQLYEFAAHSVASGRETRISKKARRDWGVDLSQASKAVSAFELMKRSSIKSSAIRRRNEWDLFEPVVEILTKEEVEALDAREERNARLKKRQEEKDDPYSNRYVRA